MKTRHAYYKGLLDDGPIFQRVSVALGEIDADWFRLSASSIKTIRAAAAGGLFSKSYPVSEMVAALLDPNMDVLPGLSRKQTAVLKFFVEVSQYAGRILLVEQQSPHSISDSYKTELLLRLYKYVEKREIRPYAKAYEKALSAAIKDIAPLCAETRLFTPARACRPGEAMNVFKTDILAGVNPVWGKFKNVRKATKQAIVAFYAVLDNWV